MELSKRLKKIIATQFEAMVENKKIAARIENNCDKLPDWFKDKPASYYHGLADARASIIESILMEHNCYNGFRERTHEVFGFEYTYNSYYFGFNLNEFSV